MRSLTLSVASESWSESVDIDDAKGSHIDCIDMLRRRFSNSGTTNSMPCSISVIVETHRASPPGYDMKSSNVKCLHVSVRPSNNSPSAEQRSCVGGEVDPPGGICIKRIKSSLYRPVDRRPPCAAAGSVRKRGLSVEKRVSGGYACRIQCGPPSMSGLSAALFVGDGLGFWLVITAWPQICILSAGATAKGPTDLACDCAPIGRDRRRYCVRASTNDSTSEPTGPIFTGLISTC